MSAHSLGRVLVALDLSPNAERAIARVARLPFGREGEVRLVHVLPPRTGKAHAAALKRANGELRDRASALQDKIARKVIPEVLAGEPYVEIIRAARRHGVQLVVMGRHSKRRLEWGLGTTAERVVRKGSTAVLVVRPEPVHRYQRPVVAVDLSEVSRTVLDLAQTVLGTQMPLRLVHAYHVPFDGFMSASISQREMESFRLEYRRIASAQLKALLAELGDETRSWPTTLREGDPRIVVIRELVRREADIAVVGTHGRTGMSHLLLGSVAEWILHNAPCDVLIGRPDRFTFEMP